MRGEPQHFVHSKVMAWVEFDRAASGVEAKAFHRSGRKWRRIANEIHAEVCEHGFDRKANSSVQSFGSKRLDASLLLNSACWFLPPDDRRVRGTLKAIEERLFVQDEFVLRYETEDGVDGLPPGEGAFLACSFWLVGNYILQDRDEDARRLFERLLTRCNDVGLLAEEFDPVARRMLGNFPQAYSHVGLINSALVLANTRVQEGTGRAPPEPGDARRQQIGMPRRERHRSKAS